MNGSYAKLLYIDVLQLLVAYAREWLNRRKSELFIYQNFLRLIDDFTNPQLVM